MEDIYIKKNKIYCVSLLFRIKKFDMSTSFQCTLLHKLMMLSFTLSETGNKNLIDETLHNHITSLLYTLKTKKERKNPTKFCLNQVHVLHDNQILKKQFISACNKYIKSDSNWKHLQQLCHYLNCYTQSIAADMSLKESSRLLIFFQPTLSTIYSKYIDEVLILPTLQNRHSAPSHYIRFIDKKDNKIITITYESTTNLQDIFNALLYVKYDGSPCNYCHRNFIDMNIYLSACNHICCYSCIEMLNLFVHAKLNN